MIKQNDKRLNGKIQAYGCNFLSHLAMARMDWTPDEIHAIYTEALTKQIIDGNCSVKKPQELLALTGSTIRQLGGVSIPTGDTWGADEFASNVRYRIARWRQRASGHQHFTLMNRNGEIYDPYDATIATYRLEKLSLSGVQYYG